MRENLVGKKFGKLTVVGGPTSRDGARWWECKCDCGGTSKVSTGSLNCGNSESCGCEKRAAGARNGKLNRVHGMTRTPVGQSWQGMLNRCYNKNQDQYEDYGGRGIKVCEFLRASPVNLKMTIGDRPPDKTIDRINNNGNYSCGKCAQCLLESWPLNIKWSGRIEQNRNRRDSNFIVINGVRKHIRQWACDSSITRGCIQHRIKAGKSGLDLLKPSRAKK